MTERPQLVTAILDNLGYPVPAAAPVERYSRLILAMASEQAVVALEKIMATKYRETIFDRTRAEGQREMLRRALDRRFADSALSERVSKIPDDQLLDAIDRALAGDADQFTAWLNQL